MANEWKFEDNSTEFLKEFKACGIAFLIEAKDSLVSQTQRNTPVSSGDLKRSFGDDSYVDEDELVAYIGSRLEHSIWVERGTGEYAVNGDGRKGGWFVPADKLDSRTKGLFETKYKFQKRKGKSGKVFYYVKGMKPHLMLYKAYLAKRKKITSEAGKRFGSLGKG